ERSSGSWCPFEACGGAPDCRCRRAAWGNAPEVVPRGKLHLPRTKRRDGSSGMAERQLVSFRAEVERNLGPWAGGGSRAGRAETQRDTGVAESGDEVSVADDRQAGIAGAGGGTG